MKRFSAKTLGALLIAAGLTLTGVAAPAMAANSASITDTNGPVTSFTGNAPVQAITIEWTFNPSHTDLDTSFYIDLNKLALPATCPTAVTTASSAALLNCGISSIEVKRLSSDTYAALDPNSTLGRTNSSRPTRLYFVRPAGQTGLTSVKISFAASALRASSIVGTYNATLNFYQDYDVNASYSITTPASYAVAFDANGGAGSMSAQTTNTPTALTANTYTRSGYSFGGWATSQSNASAGTVAYANGATYDFSAATTLYAIWTLNSGGGSSSDAGLANTGFAPLPYVATGGALTLLGFALVLLNRPRRARH